MLLAEKDLGETVACLIRLQTFSCVPCLVKKNRTIVPPRHVHDPARLPRDDLLFHNSRHFHRPLPQTCDNHTTLPAIHLLKRTLRRGAASVAVLPTHQQFCPDNLIQELQEAVTTAHNLV